jgi:hypothetical protein
MMLPPVDRHVTVCTSLTVKINRWFLVTRAAFYRTVSQASVRRRPRQSSKHVDIVVPFLIFLPKTPFDFMNADLDTAALFDDKSLKKHVFYPSPASAS